MKLAQIEALSAVIRAGSISQAARQLHLTQPALSLQIRDLEEYFCTKLIERTNKGVKPTPAGELVYFYGQKIMGTKEVLISEIEKLQSNTVKQLRLGASTVVGGYAIPCSIHCFKEKHPYAQINLTVANSHCIQEMMLEGKLDVAVVEGPLPEKVSGGDFISRSIGEDDLMLVGTPSFSPEGKAVALEEMKEIPLIVREQGCGVRATVEQAMREKGVHPEELNIMMEVNSLDAIKASIATGKGCSILSYISVRRELYYGILKGIPINGLSFKNIFTLLHRRNAFLSPLEKSFVEFMRSNDRSFC